MAGARHTFLFADLVGYTALTSAEGDDRAADVAHQLYAHARSLLGDHDAEEVKTLGDGLMLRSERPRAAICLGLAIVSGLEELPGFPPVRVGIHTGPAVQRDGDWYGATVNVAARLCHAAGGGEVLVSAATREAAGRVRHADWGERRLHWLRNVPDPIPAHVAAEHACRLAGMRRAKRGWARRRVQQVAP